MIACCVFLIVSVLLSLSLVLLIRHNLCMETVVFCFVKLFQTSGFRSLPVDFLEKGRLL